VRLPFGDVQLPDELRRRIESSSGGARDVIAGVRPEHFESAEIAGPDQPGGVRFRTKIDVSSRWAPSSTSTSAWRARRAPISSPSSRRTPGSPSCRGPRTPRRSSPASPRRPTSARAPRPTSCWTRPGSSSSTPRAATTSPRGPPGSARARARGRPSRSRARARDRRRHLEESSGGPSGARAAGH
jgi:hypothetical protein